MLTFIFVLSLAVFVSTESVKTHEGYKVYEVLVKTKAEAQLLLSYENDRNFDFWLLPRVYNVSAKLMVAPKAQQFFEIELHENNLEYSILIENVQKSIDAENVRQRATSRMLRRLGDVTFNHYMRYNEMTAYMRRVARDYPNIVTLVELGKSFEGREMLLLKISSDHGASKKPVIFIDAGIHAREWIAPPIALYIIHQLVENPANRDMLDKVDWAISPCINPDGYEFTQSDNRLWRKTRTPGVQCYGTDPNRNFGYQWMVAGASSDECSEIYAGPTPFSEPETQHIRDYLLSNQDDIKLYLTFHSYGSLLLYPWGYTSELPDDDAELRSLAEKVRTAIVHVHGTQYIYGTSTNVLYEAAGGSDDYAKGVAGIQLAYCIELPEGGNTGFNPPANQIRPIAEETFAGIRAYHQHIEEKFGNNIPLL